MLCDTLLPSITKSEKHLRFERRQPRILDCGCHYTRVCLFGKEILVITVRLALSLAPYSPQNHALSKYSGVCKAIGRRRATPFALIVRRGAAEPQALSLYLYQHHNTTHENHLRTTK
jgi:hypothetical protein